MKKLFLLLFTFIILVSVFGGAVGCTNSRDELIIWWPSGATTEKVINDAIENFKKDNPDTKIKVVNKPGMDVFDAYKISLNDDSTRPDIAILDHVYTQSLAHDNLIADLSAMGADTLKTKYPDAIYNANTYNNKAYALPLSANTVIMMYNKNILDLAGVTEIPTTYEELLSACQKIKEKGKIPFAQPIDTFAAMQFVADVAKVGGKIVSDDYKTILLDSQPVVKAVNDWKKFTDLGYANKVAFEEDKFYNGQVAFIEMGSWNISKVTGATSRFDCGFAEVVKIDGNLPNYSGLGLYSLAISQKSNKKEAAFKFAQYLSTNTEVQLAFNKAKNLLPVTNEALSDSYYADDAILSKYASQMQKLVSRPGTPVWPDLEQAIVTLLRSSILNNNVEGAIKSAQNEAQAACDRLFA